MSIIIFMITYLQKISPKVYMVNKMMYVAFYCWPNLKIIYSLSNHIKSIGWILFFIYGVK